ncbi:hypothetical protein FBY35_0728 [Streptomyces sp. SLBN-118]|uniref:hypothetical protein n=1 Tax=Streptomyces sp. SLBN-118 TaxID=2768454 RepID=UPI0011522949|nr:hypothetical protein [Streptomyces sp. SLBN-118]TQK50399.1 hypothetical protein FBY35_0728 [Streptomyces sp. SLBN-118]
MRKLSARHALLAALATISLFASGCSAGTGESSPAAAAADGPTPTVTLTPDPGPSRQLPVAAAPEGKPTAVARSGAGGAKKSPLKVASYDRGSRRAVISTAGKSPSTTSPDTSPSETAPAEDAPAVGDIIASGPAPGAPDGLLAKVTGVAGKTEKGTEVRTEPSTLGALLGDDRAEGTVPVDPASVGVEPLVKGVKVSWAKTGNIHVGPQGAKVPLGSLRIDVGASVPLPVTEGAPVSGGASVSGFVQLAPEVEFSYDGSSAFTPDSAFLGLTGDWTSRWELKGRASAGGKPVRIPFAKLHADPVIQVGPVPVVVNLDLTAYVQVAADGTVTVEVKQDLKGGFRIGGSYTKAGGWKPVSTSDITGTPVQAKATAAGQVKAALGAEATVGLYGAAGVTADLAPYVRGEVSATATPGSVVGAWKIYGGVDLAGWLQLQLSIFGTPIFEHRIPLGALHREWPLAQGKGALV